MFIGAIQLIIELYGLYYILANHTISGSNGTIISDAEPLYHDPAINESYDSANRELWKHGGWWAENVKIVISTFLIFNLDIF